MYGLFCKKIKSNVLTVCGIFMITTALQIVSSHRHRAKITSNFFFDPVAPSF